MKYYIEKIQHNGKQAWRIIGPNKEYIENAIYNSSESAEAACRMYNNHYENLVQALELNKIMEPCPINDGKVVALIGQAARIKTGRNTYANSLLPCYVQPKIGDTLFIKEGLIIIKEINGVKSGIDR